MTFPAPARGFLIDLDGTLLEAQNLVPGAAQALAFLRAREVPYRLVTNTTSKPHSAIMEKIRSHRVGSSTGTPSSPRRSLGVNIFSRKGLPVVTLWSEIRCGKIYMALSSSSTRRKRCSSAIWGRSSATEHSIAVFASCSMMRSPLLRLPEIAIFEAATDCAWTSAPRLPLWSMRPAEPPFSSENLRANFFSALVKAWVWHPKTRSSSGTIWRPTSVEQSLRVVTASWFVLESSDLFSWKTRLSAPTECSIPWRTSPSFLVKER